MTKLFISYARKDETEIQPLAQELRDLGFEVWMDVSGIKGGEDWSSKIVKSIKGCDFFLLFVSSASIQSDSVRREVALAYKNRKSIIPLRLEEVNIPLEWDYQTIGIQWIECREANWKSRLLVALGDKRSTPGIVSHPIKKQPKHRERLVQIIIDGKIDDFNDTRKENLVATMSAILGVDKDEIRLLSVNAGSIVLEIAMSEKAMNRLFDLARNRDFRIMKQGILSIIFNLDDVVSQNPNIINTDDPFISINQSQRTLEIELRYKQNTEASFAKWRLPSLVLMSATGAAGVIIVAAIIFYFGSISQAAVSRAATQTAHAIGTSYALATQTHLAHAMGTEMVFPTPTFILATPATSTDTPAPPNEIDRINLVEIFPPIGDGGYFWSFKPEGTNSDFVFFTSRACAHSGDVGLEANYHITHPAFASWGLEWDTSFLGYLDASQFTKLVLWVKGQTGGEKYLIVILKDKTMSEDEDGQELKLDRLFGNHIKPEIWTKVEIPLSEFTQVQLAQLTQLQILTIFEENGSGGVCIDDISLEK
jgi:hypothetical protein